MKLYSYDHCPFCVKARMIFGLKNVPVEVVTLLNDDEENPIRMVGAKMLPILEKEDGSHMGESMDIVHYIDAQYGEGKLLSEGAKPQWEKWVSETFPVALPLYLAVNGMAPFEEFATTASRAYYTRKKEANGAFGDAFTHRDAHVQAINEQLTKLEPLLDGQADPSAALDEADIHLYALLRGLTIIKGLEFPPHVLAYIRTMETRSGVPTLFDIAG